MSESDLLYHELTRKTLGAFFQVHSDLGEGSWRRILPLPPLPPLAALASGQAAALASGQAAALASGQAASLAIRMTHHGNLNAPATLTGTNCATPLPSPSSPCRFSPQQYA
jgi:hypothetical protein